MDQPTDTDKQKFLNDCNARRTGWAGFQKGTRRAAERMVRTRKNDALRKGNDA